MHLGPDDTWSAQHLFLNVQKELNTKRRMGRRPLRGGCKMTIKWNHPDIQVEPGKNLDQRIWGTREAEVSSAWGCGYADIRCWGPPSTGCHIHLIFPTFGAWDLHFKRTPRWCLCEWLAEHAWWTKEVDGKGSILYSLIQSLWDQDIEASYGCISGKEKVHNWIE